MSMRIAGLSILGLLVLVACGETRGQRVLTGAAGGAVAGEVLADEPLIGAGIGAAAGAVR